MDIRQKALAVIARVSGREIDSLSVDQELVGDLGIDSPKALELLVDLEETLAIEISDEVAARMETVGDVLAHLGAGS